jgi:hypothetical protein
MKKKTTAAILLAATMMITLMGCGSTSESDTSLDISSTEVSAESLNYDDSAKSSISVEAPGDRDDVIADTSDSTDTTALSDDSFIYNGNKVSILDDGDTIASSMGTPGSTAADRDLTYNFYTDKDGADSVSSTIFSYNGSKLPIEIVISSPDIQTSKGIHVGSSQEEVEAVYGNNAEKDEYIITYDFKKFSIRFQMMNGAVIHIYYINTDNEKAFDANR